MLGKCTSKLLANATGRGKEEGARVVAAAKAIRGGVVYDLKTFVTVVGIITQRLYGTLN